MKIFADMNRNRRIGRLAYLGYRIQIFIIAFVVLLPSGMIVPRDLHITICEYSQYFIMLPSIWICTLRGKDLGIPVVLSAFLVLIPYISYIYQIYLLLRKGTNGSNKYGPEPTFPKDSRDIRSDWVAT